MEVDIGFSMLKSKEQNTEEEKKDVSKKIEHAKRKQKRNMQKKAKKGER